MKIGILSFAHHHGEAYISNLRRMDGVELLGVADDDATRGEAIARQHEARYFPSYEALLEAKPDGVIICTENNRHRPLVEMAASQGVNVLCEKPIALSVEDVDAMAAAAQKHGRLVAEAFMYRHHAQTLKVQELVKTGSIGTLKLIRGSFSFVLDREGDIRLDPAMGGGSIWDVGCYPISYMRTVVGAEPKSVFGQQVTGPTGIDDTFVGQLQFGDDVYGQFDSSFSIPFHAYMEFVGSEATLIVPEPFKPGEKEKIFLVRDGKTETIKVKGEELYLGEVEDMADAINTGKAPRISLDDSRANVETILALLESARTNKPIKL